MSPGLVVNADDLAIHPRTNAGIFSAWRSGIVTSATMLVTTPYFEQTVHELGRGDGPPIGIHLSLTLGKAVAGHREVPNLTDEEGDFTQSSAGLLLTRLTGENGRRLLPQIRRELEAQLGLARDHGLRPTHADSHQHVHMHPAIFSLLEEILPRFGIGRVRHSLETLSLAAVIGLLGQGKPINLAKVALLRLLSRRVRPRLATTDGFFGVLYSGVVTKHAIAAAIESLARDRSLEICVHPGLPDAENRPAYPRGYENDFIGSVARRREHDILVDPDLRELVRRRGLTLVSFDGRAKAR